VASLGEVLKGQLETQESVVALRDEIRSFKQIAVPLMGTIQEVGVLNSEVYPIDFKLDQRQCHNMKWVIGDTVIFKTS
jgi:hypothetical protein